jgi:hypothetical protein
MKPQCSLIWQKPSILFHITISYIVSNTASSFPDIFYLFWNLPFKWNNQVNSTLSETANVNPGVPQSIVVGLNLPMLRKSYRLIKNEDLLMSKMT